MKGKYITKRDADAKAFSTKYARDIYVLKTKIAHVEDKIKITEIDKQKLKKLEKEKISKIEEEKKNIEIAIDKNLKELNSKKEKIFKIQKPIVDNFRKTLNKLTQAYEESVNKSNQLLNGDNELNSKKDELKNEGQKIKENYEQATEEFNQLKQEAQEKLKEMNTLKEEYPKEYQYFQEKMKLFKKINDLKEENKKINKQIKNLQKNISDDDRIKNEKNSMQKKLSTEKQRNQNKIEELKSGVALEQLESDLKKHNSDIFSWSYIKEIMVQYYGERYYDETTDEYIDNLRNMWTNRINYIFNEEYLRTKRAKESRLETIMNRLSELELNNKNESEEAKKLNEESDNLKDELTIDENDFNKVYSLFNDVILLLNQINDENKDTLFSNHFIEAIININPDYSTNMKEYAKKNFDRLINLYINELIEHSKSKKNLIMRNKKCDEFIEEKNNENLLLEDQIKTNNDKLNELTNKKQENLKEISKIQNLIDVKTTEMKKYLNEISEEKFKKYKEENSETLKNFHKIYGKKILTKANKVQKEKIYEDRINEHIKMKDLMENISKYITDYQNKTKEINEKITSYADKYQELMDQVDEIELG
jgi:chromosome segregation ATPase